MPIDYSKFKDVNDKDASPDTEGQKVRWWEEEDEDLASAAVAATLKLLVDAQVVRRSQLVANARAYGNLPMSGFLGMTMTKMQSSPASGLGERVSYNVVKAVSDTAVSRIGKNKPEPYFLTSGGNYRMRRKAKRLNKFVRGLFDANDAYTLGIKALLDGIVFGDGATHVYVEDDKIKFERVLINELFIDEIESFASAPRQLVWVRQVDRGVAMDRWPEHAEFIKNSFSMETQGVAYKPNVADLVTVYEAWRLPDGPNSKPGKHIVCIDGHALTKMEDWEYDFFPFAFFQWSSRLYGFWGMGLPEEIQSLQTELNRVMRLKQRSFHLAGTFKILVEAGSKVVSEHIDKEVGTIIRYQGTPPQYILPPVVQPELFQYENEIKQDAYNQPGINQMASQGTKPQGINSGKAIREYDDLQTDRLNTPGQAYERYFLQLAKVALGLVREIKHYKVQFQHKSWMEEIDWTDINLKETEYRIQCFPISSLPNSPAGRLETVQELAQAGMYTLREAKRLLNFPDLEQVDSLQVAAEEYLLMCLDKIVDDGEPCVLDMYDDSNLALELGLEYYQMGKLHGLEEERLELLIQFIEQAKRLIKAAMPPPAPTAGPGQGPAQADPAPAPVSPMLPNAPQ